MYMTFVSSYSSMAMFLAINSFPLYPLRVKILAFNSNYILRKFHVQTFPKPCYFILPSHGKNVINPAKLIFWSYKDLRT